MSPIGHARRLRSIFNFARNDRTGLGELGNRVEEKCLDKSRPMNLALER